MPVNDNAELARLYRRLLTTRGFSPLAMFYASEGQHVRKMETFAEVLRERTPASVLDVGCGYGELLRFWTPDKYLGVDLVEAFACEAKRRYPSKNFVVADLMTVPLAARSSQTVVLAGVLSSVPDPLGLLRRCCTFAEDVVVFDITLRERLPPSFHDLNRLELVDVRSVVESEQFDVSAVVDRGEPWAIVTAVRREHDPRAALSVLRDGTCE